jgi:hypothetical protein
MFGSDLVPLSKFIYAIRMWDNNRFIDFQDASGGPNLVADIGNGFRLPEELGRYASSAMNEASQNHASGASSTFIVSFDRTTEKYTIDGLGTTFEACSAAADWDQGAGSAEAPQLNTTYYRVASGSISGAVATSGGGSFGYYASAFAQQDLDGKDVGFDIRFSENVNLVAAPGSGLNFIRFYLFTGTGVSPDYYFKDFQASGMSSGWNFVQAVDFPTGWSSAGSPTASAIDQIQIVFNKHITETYEHGDILWDNFNTNSFLSLLWNTGASAASGAASALGFSASADDTGTLTYEGDTVLPNRLFPSQPIRRPVPRFRSVSRESISESGVRAVGYSRTDIEFSFRMLYIPENEMKDDWAPFMGKVDGVPGPWQQGIDFDWYPNKNNASYIRFHPLNMDWDLDEMFDQGMPAYFMWTMEMREVIPEGGNISLIEIYTRTP